MSVQELREELGKTESLWLLKGDAPRNEYGITVFAVVCSGSLEAIEQARAALGDRQWEVWDYAMLHTWTSGEYFE